MAHQSEVCERDQPRHRAEASRHCIAQQEILHRRADADANAMRATIAVRSVPGAEPTIPGVHGSHLKVMRRDHITTGDFK
jgi:hypothetical protein